MKTKYYYATSKDEWVGIVAEGVEVLTVGCERTETGIKHWLQQALTHKPWIEGNPEVPDMYDRTSTKRH
jgi:hypothetical protein